MSGGMRLCACLLNISEARNKSVVDAVVTAALRCNADDTTSTTTSNVRPNNVTTSPSSPDHTNYNVGDGSRHIQGKGQRRSDGHVTGQAQSDRVNTLGKRSILILALGVAYATPPFTPPHTHNHIVSLRLSSSSLMPWYGPLSPKPAVNTSCLIQRDTASSLTIPWLVYGIVSQMY